MTAIASGVLLALLLARAREWNPALSYDTAAYYYPASHVNRSGFDLPAALSSFLTRRSDIQEEDEVRADQSKPFFVFLLRLWHQGWSLARPGSLPLPNHASYSDFVTCAYALAFVACCALGARAGVPFLALAAAAMTFFSPWMICASYFNTYTAPSLLLLASSVFLLAAPRPAPLAAGLLCGLNAWTNQSTLAFTAGMLALLACRPAGRSELLGRAGRFAAGFLLVFLTTDLVILAINFRTQAEILPQAELLLRYLQKSMPDGSEMFAAHRGWLGASLFPRMLWEHSAVLSVIGLVLLGEAAIAASRGRLRLDRVAAGLGLFLLLTLLVIDVRPGPKCGRTYVLMLPFLNLLAVGGLRRKWEAWAGWPGLRTLLASLLIGAYGIETVHALGVFDETFLGVRRRLERHDPREPPVEVAAADTFLPMFRELLDDVPPEKRRLRELGDICGQIRENGDAPLLVAVGPNVESMLTLPTARTGTVSLPMPPLSQAEGEPGGRCDDGVTWTAELAEALPFFAHYPFLVFEDPEHTYRMVAAREYSTRSYREPFGQVTFWRIRAGPAAPATGRRSDGRLSSRVPG